MTIKVKGMSCGNCEKHVKEALKSIGLKKIKVNLETGDVSFKNKKELPLEQISLKIAEIGYEVVA